MKDTENTAWNLQKIQFPLIFVGILLNQPFKKTMCIQHLNVSFRGMGKSDVETLILCFIRFFNYAHGDLDVCLVALVQFIQITSLTMPKQLVQTNDILHCLLSQMFLELSHCTAAARIMFTLRANCFDMTKH